MNIDCSCQNNCLTTWLLVLCPEAPFLIGVCWSETFKPPTSCTETGKCSHVSSPPEWPHSFPEGLWLRHRTCKSCDMMWDKLFVFLFGAQARIQIATAWNMWLWTVCQSAVNKSKCERTNDIILQIDALSCLVTTSIKGKTLTFLKCTIA